jgi:large subunit ribosomal protein L30
MTKAESNQLKIKLIKSGTGFPESQKRVIKGLGFTRLNQVISRPDSPAIRGMIFKVRHLVEVVQE